MAKIFENRQVLHVVSEIVVFMAFSYSVSSKFKTLKTYIDDICNRLDEQDEIITKQGQQIDYLNSRLLYLTAEVEKINAGSQPSRPQTVSFQKVQLPQKRSVESKNHDKKQKSHVKSSTSPEKKKTGSVELSVNNTMDNSFRNDSHLNPILEQATMSSVTFIPMSINPFNTGGRASSVTSFADVEEVDSDEELDQELEKELQELDLKDEVDDSKEIKEEDE